ncbi:hypothetical protein ACFO26_00365 [Lactococcus nasutitermitis]|uniref:LytTR family transcriptional regulator n=1 Tax=Lactococcus nasutitermitis TaxID=1652957 RepID=A0ABV9J9K3_9LACT|nr:hypothetical protein [Lactococcus nasutitermitis]
MAKKSILVLESGNQYIHSLTHKKVMKKEEYQLYVNGIMLSDEIDETLYLKHLFLSSLFGNRIFLTFEPSEIENIKKFIQKLPSTVQIILKFPKNYSMADIDVRNKKRISVIVVNDRIYIQRRGYYQLFTKECELTQHELLMVSSVIFLPDYVFQSYRKEEDLDGFMDGKIKCYCNAEKIFTEKFALILKNIKETAV